MTSLLDDRPVESADEPRPDAPVAETPAPLSTLRLAWLWAWPTLLVISVYTRFGGTSLVSPDDGFILAQSRRILEGQVPHRDFISPRPAGSALLHCIDFLLPMPLLSASRLITTIEVVVYTLAFASIAYRRPIRSWTLVQVLGAAAAVFVNLHSFPLMAWHTIDGIFLVALGLLALRSGLATKHLPRIYGGLLLLGAALVVKQSFAPALVIGAAMVWENRRQPTSGPVSTRRAAAVLAAPILLYALAITAAGGLHPMIVQLAHAEPVYGGWLFTSLGNRGGQGWLLIAAATVLCLIDLSAARSAAGEWVARLGARAGLTALVVGIVLVTRTDPADAWGRALWTMLIVIVVWEWFALHEIDRFGLVMIAAGWMISLSWGYPSPRLAAGSIALVVLDRVWRTAPPLPSDIAQKVAHATKVLAVVMSIAVMATAIHERAVLNAQGAMGDSSIGDVAPGLRGLATDLTTSQLIRGVAACHALYPARWTALLPGPAIVTPILDLSNPFSVDWVYPLEIRGSEGRLEQEARALDANGDYLVLVPRAPVITADANPVLARMLAQLHGVRTICGSFTAIHPA